MIRIFLPLLLLPLTAAADETKGMQVTSLYHDATPAQRWALLIGVDDYDSEDIVDLRYAGRDVRALAKQLISSGTYEAEQVIVLTPNSRDPSLRPTRENILRKLKTLQSIDEQSELDSLFFFFSGHGAGGADGENYLFPQNTDSALLSDTALSLDRVMSDINAINARQRFVVLDACRNRVVTGAKASPATWSDPEYAEARGTYILFGTEFNAYSYEDDDAKLSALTRFLLEGMAGAADGLTIEDGIVSANELFAYTHRELSRWSLNAGRAQIPWRAGEYTGVDFPIVGIPGWSPPPEPVDPGIQVVQVVQETASVKVVAYNLRNKPMNSTVWIDGERLGKTPWDGALAPGEYTVQVEDVTRSLSVTPGVNESLNLTLERSGARALIWSGAALEVGGTALAWLSVQGASSTEDDQAWIVANSVSWGVAGAGLGLSAVGTARRGTAEGLIWSGAATTASGLLSVGFAHRFYDKADEHLKSQLVMGEIGGWTAAALGVGVAGLGVWGQARAMATVSPGGLRIQGQF